MFLKVLGWVLPLILWKVIVLGQPTSDPALRVRAITVNDGLPQGSVIAAAQDSKGFIWIASDGLSRFDGRNFVHFRHVTGDASSLTSNNIDYMRMDDRDNLWLIYSSQEVDVFNTVTHHIRHISVEPSFRWLKPESPAVYFIAQEGPHYFEANLTSLTVFNPWGTYKEKIPLPAGESLLAIGAAHRYTMAATNKALYAIRGNRLLQIAGFPQESKKAEEFVQAATRNHSRIPGRIREYPNGTLAIPGSESIYLYHPQQRTITSIPAGSSRVPWGIQQADGYTYANTNNGLIRLDEQGMVTPLTHAKDLFTSDAMLIDRSGVLWAGTVNALGLRLFDLRPLNFRSYPYRNGFLHDVLEPWLHHPMQDAVAYGSYNGRCAKDRDGNVWAVCYLYTDANGKKTNWPGSGVYRLGAGNATRLPFYLPDWKVSNITFDDYNQCWLTLTALNGDGNKLVKVNTQTGAVAPFARLPDTITENFHLSAAGKKICVLTENELRLYDTATAAGIVIPKATMGVDGMLLMALPDLHNGRLLWLATKGSGIIRLNTATGQVVHYTEANGLPNNTVYFMAADKRGFFWCSSNKGIFRFDPASNAVMSFTAKDGLQGNEFNRYHFIETPDGHFVFGGPEGYTVFHPDSIRMDDFQPLVAITGILVNNHPLQAWFPALKSSAISDLQQLTLAYDQTLLSINFAALQYNAPEEIHYRYQLVGCDEDWVDAANRSNATYVSIPPGHYTFRVNASNTSGIWSKQVKTLAITVLPPWWSTWWANTLYVLAGISITYSLYRNWLRRAQDRQHIILQQKEAVQLKALDEMKGRFFSNIAHEFRIPLSLIIAPVEKMQRESTEPRTRQQLGSVQQQAELLLQLINQLLDMAKLEANNMSISLYQGNLSLFIRDVAGSFADYAQNKQVLLTRYLPDDATTAHAFDADKLRTVLQNLLSNAIKFTPAGGSVTLEATVEPGSGTAGLLQITVKDTGIGIPANKLPHIFDRFYQVDDSRTRQYGGTGIGLALVKELTELMGGSITAASTATAGMLFTLRLPVEKATGTETALSLPVSSGLYPSDSQSPDEAPAAGRQESGSGKPLLLIAEDHEELRLFITALFSQSCQVLTASNGEEAWGLARQRVPDAIISDIMMPGIDGIELCRRVKTTPDTAHIAFVMLTAKTAQDSKLQGLQSKADDYISKPFHAGELQLKVQNILDHQQQLRNFYNRKLMTAAEPLQQEEVTDPFLLQVYQQLEKHLDDAEFTVDKLAALVTVSTRTLVRKLQAIAGITPIELIRQYRLKRAAELLREGKPVSEVAWSVGYETRNYFSTAFKSFYGITPSEYKKMYTGK